MQGDSEALWLRRSAGELTDGAGLLLVRKVWDRMDLGTWLHQRNRPSLMVEQWMALLTYGGRDMDDLPRLATRGVRRLFGWQAVLDPTTYGPFVGRRRQ